MPVTEISAADLLAQLERHRTLRLIFNYEGRDVSLGYHVTEFKTGAFQALDCGAYLFKNEFKIELDPPIEGEPDSPWTVQVIPFLAPTHEDISGLEAHLAEVARHFGGKCSGWGCEQAVVPERN